MQLLDSIFFNLPLILGTLKLGIEQLFIGEISLELELDFTLE